MSSLDREIDELTSLLAKLSHKHVGLYFAACGERLLPFYEVFHRKESWGEPRVLREALDCVWAALSGTAEDHWSKLIAEIERVTPHADDFDNLAVIGAQDACILIDSAIRALNKEPIPDALEYVFEFSRAAACVQKTGNLQLGSDAESELFEESLVDVPLIEQELKFHRSLIHQVTTWTGGDVSVFRELTLTHPLQLPGANS